MAWMKLDIRLFDDPLIADGPLLTAHMYLWCVARRIDTGRYDFLLADVIAMARNRLPESRSTMKEIRSAVDYLTEKGLIEVDGRGVVTVHDHLVEKAVQPNDRRDIDRQSAIVTYNRDQACRFCGSTENLEVDHIHPWSRGGSRSSCNLQMLCRSCNIRKSNK